MQAQAARELADRLKAEADLLLHTDPDGALRTAERIAELAESAHDTRICALGELAVADALRMLGRFGDALEAYARSAELYRQVDDEVGWARTRIGATVTWRYTGLAPDALTDIDRARTILKRHQLWLRLARLEQHAGILLCELGQFGHATEAYDRALVAARKLDPRDEPQEARILGNLALACQRLGDYERAERLHADALAVFEAHGHSQDLALAQANSAQLLVDRAHYSRALEMATSARRGFLALDHTSDAAFVGRVATHCLLELNRFEDAVALASVVADEFARAGAAINQAATLLLRSIGLRRLGRFDETMADLNRAQRIFAASECEGWVAVTRGERAALFEAQGAWHEAVTEGAAAARELAANGQVVSAAQAGLVRAAALRQLGDGAAAHTVVREVLATIDARGVPWLAYQAWRLAGRLALEMGESADALAAFQAAVQALEQVQGRILTEARASFLSGKLDVYEDAIGLLVERGDADAAFEYAERAKSRALVDALAGRLDIRVRPRTQQQQRLADELTRLRRQHEQLAIRAANTLGASEGAESLPREANARDLADCEERITALLDELRLSNVDDLERVALLQGEVFPLALQSDTRLVEYFALGDDLCVFVRSPDGIIARRLPDACRQVERLSGVLDLGMQTAAVVHGRPDQSSAVDASIRRALGSLYRVLVAPVAGALDGATRLVIVPHGVLHRIPFAALYDGERFLLERFELVYGPSASALAFCRRPVAKLTDRLLVVAHSHAGTLPGAVREAERIAALFDAECLLDDNATRERVVERAQGAGLLHFATHGYARLDAPLFSYLRLADGHLTALDCFDLELDCALVTLSACDSGRGQIVAGDESIGLPRALLYAGARSVVQTLWRIDDDSTALLMERFYRELRRGTGRAAALRVAQLEALGMHGHPFFWAATMLIGEWGPLPSRNVAHG